MATATKPPMVGMREVAARLNVQYETALGWANDGKLPFAIRVGKLWRIDPHRLDEFCRGESTPAGCSDR
jgi:excisionase family DNA binding protein